MSLTSLLIPTYRHMLQRMADWLDKAEAALAGGAGGALPGARLAPDMFPLATQVRFACAQALEGICRLRDEPFPPLHQAMLDEGRAAGDHPGTLADARSRIAETLAYLDALSHDVEDLDPASPIAHDLPMGLVFDLTAEQYARDWALPQFYFHVMTAYAILRSAGVTLGKADYVSHMFAYARPGTLPDR